MQTTALAATLNGAADYLDAHGLRLRGWGRPGGSVCMAAAIAIALDHDPAGLGRGCVHAPVANEAVDAVGGVILASGLLDYLPPTERGERPLAMTPALAVRALARWSDRVGLDAGYAAAALRAVAVRLRPRLEKTERVAALASVVGPARELVTA